MTVALTMIVKNEAAVLPRTLPTYLNLIDSWLIVDTGSTDGTQKIASALLGSLPGEVVEVEWVDFSHARNAALDYARGSADWLLMPDADMTAEIHPDLRSWLAADPDPAVDAWMVTIEEGSCWERPLLLRGYQEWRYEMPVHEFLDTAGRETRGLLGLTLHHSRPGPTPEGKYDRYADLLREGAEAGEPRHLFYLAECLRYAGRTDQAIAAYQQRAQMADGYVEEAWFSAYQAARLMEDVDELMACWRTRPWRHEPLTAAARLVAQRHNPDHLFREPPP